MHHKYNFKQLYFTIFFGFSFIFGLFRERVLLKFSVFIFYRFQRYKHHTKEVHNPVALCLDIDECKVNNGGCTQHCRNIPGIFECFCDNGFKLQEDDKSCEGVCCRPWGDSVYQLRGTCHYATKFGPKNPDKKSPKWRDFVTIELINLLFC